MTPCWLVGLAFALTTLGACDHGREAVSTTAKQAETTTTAAGCGEGVARSVVERFLAAYNAGESGLTDKFFARGDRFQWYSDDPGRVMTASTGPTSDPYDRSTLNRFLTDRQSGGDRMTLAALTDFNVRATDGTASFALTVSRPSGVSAGKATLDCRTQQLMVVSLGRPSSA